MESDYKGEPIATLSSVVDASSSLEDVPEVEAAIAWNGLTEDGPIWVGERIEVTGSFPASFNLNLYAAPPAEAEVRTVFDYCMTDLATGEGGSGGEPCEGLLIPKGTGTGMWVVARFGSFIGSNRGAAHEALLRYAGSDAQRMQETLVELGSLPAINAVVLREPDADTARGALIALNDRIRAAATRPDTQVMLFVYYSGHADKHALHLGETRLPLVELEQLVRGSAAHFRVLLLDACGSGALTRQKGGTPAPPFPVALGEKLDGQGVAFLTSSSASEDAQESDALGGSFKASFVLTETRAVRARGELIFPEGRDYLVLREGEDGPVVAEVVASARTRRLSVREGRYFVRGRASAYVLEGALSIDAGESVRVGDERLERVEYARLVRKGGGVIANVSGPLAGYTLRGPLESGSGPCHGVFAGYVFAWPALTLTPRLDACSGSGFENTRVDASFFEVGGDVRISHAWDLPIVTLDLGFSVGAAWLRQSFVTRGVAPARDSVALRSSVGPSATFELGSGLYFNVDIAAETYAFSVQDTDTRASELRPSLAFRTRAGLGKQW